MRLAVRCAGRRCRHVRNVHAYAPEEEKKTRARAVVGEGRVPPSSRARARAARSRAPAAARIAPEERQIAGYGGHQTVFHEQGDPFRFVCRGGAGLAAARLPTQIRKKSAWLR
jgi:hypothetical protein